MLIRFIMIFTSLALAENNGGLMKKSRLHHPWSEPDITDIDKLFDVTLIDGSAGGDPRVITDYGEIIGTQGTTLKGRKYNAFYSIPYAKKPIGTARFEEAKEPTPWSEPLNGSVFPPVCIQLNNRGESFGVEDCLYLNVFTPTNLKNLSYPLPVIVFVHGGAFYFFSGNTFGPRYLLDKEVILVTFNYRLGIFGFLSTEDEIVPGNNGLKDQTMALGWIQRNIAYFGGNPRSVTLMGFSAGAVSIHYHYFSILSRGLFHRGYLLGGTSFNSWAIQKNSLQKAKTAAEAVDCPTGPVRRMVQCLKRVPAENLALTTKLFLKFYRTPLSPWGPVVDRKWSKNPFLEEFPILSILAGRHYNVPLMASESSKSGLIPIAEFIEDVNAIENLDQNWIKLAPYLLDTVETVPHRLQQKTMNMVRSFYFGKQPLLENRSALIQVGTDRLFQADIGRALSAHATINRKVYLYMFNYRGAKSSSDAISGTKKKYGVSHIDDLYYLMNITTSEPIEEEMTGLDMIDKMTEMLYTFSKTGKPVFLKGTRWPPVSGTLQSIRYLRIDSPNSAEMVTSRDLGNGKFWSSLPINEPWSGRTYDD